MKYQEFLYVFVMLLYFILLLDSHNIYLIIYYIGITIRISMYYISSRSI